MAERSIGRERQPAVPSALAEQPKPDELSRGGAARDSPRSPRAESERRSLKSPLPQGRALVNARSQQQPPRIPTLRRPAGAGRFSRGPHGWLQKRMHGSRRTRSNALGSTCDRSSAAIGSRLMVSLPISAHCHRIGGAGRAATVTQIMELWPRPSAIALLVGLGARRGAIIVTARRPRIQDRGRPA